MTVDWHKESYLPFVDHDILIENGPGFHNQCSAPTATELAQSMSGE